MSSARWLRAPLIALALLLAGDHFGSAQTAPLTFVSGTIVGDAVTLTFSEALDTTSVPSTSAFTVRTHGSSTVRRVSNVSISGSNVTFDISIFVDRADAATVAYCTSGSNCGGAIRSQDGARTFTSYGALTPIRTPGPAPRVSGVTADAYTITIDLDRSLDTSVVPATSAFTVNGFTTTVRKVAIASRKVTLHIVPPLPRWQHTDSEDWTLTYTLPSSNSLRTPTPSAFVAAFASRAISVTNGKLVVAALAVDGATVDLTFRVDLDENREPNNDKFKVCASETTSDSSCTDATDIEISGKVVTVTFPSTALAAGTTVWLRYSGTRLRGSSGSRTEVRRIENHRIVLPSTAAPTFSSGAADGSTVVLTFDSALDSTAVPLASAFEVNGTAASAVSISGSQVTLTLGSAVAEGAAVSVEYTAAGTTKLQGSNGVAVAAFTSSVTNNTDTAPAPASTSINGTELSITFDQALDTSSSPAASDFAVSVGGTSATVSAVALAGSAASLTLASAVDADDVVTVSYTQPAAGGLRDSTSNRTASFGPLTATNATAPAPASATVDGDLLTITFNADLDTTSTPLAAAFTVAGRTVSAPTVRTRSVELSLAPAVKEGAAVVVSYDSMLAGSGALEGASGSAVASFSSFGVTNETDTAPAYVSGSVNGATVTLTFDQNLDTTSVPPVITQGLSTLSAFRVTVNDLRVGYSAAVASGATVTITLLAAVAPSDVVKVQYQLQTNLPLRDTSTPANQAPSFDFQTLTNTTPARASSAAVTGWTLAVTFSGSLDTDPLPDKSAFSVTSGADSLTIDSISASGSTLSLRLNAAVGRTAAVRVAYTPPMTNPLQDLNSRTVPAFTLDATNNTPAAPTVSTATADGVTVTVAFNRTLSSTSTTAVSAFTVNTAAPTNAAVTNGQLVLTVSPAIKEGAAVSVAYTPAATATLIDLHGLSVAAFTTTATNNTDTAPSTSSATASAQAVSVVFDQALDGTSTPPKPAFSLGSGAPAVTGVSISDKTVTLSLACCVLPGDTVRLTYTPDASTPLRDSTSNAVTSFTIDVTNGVQQGPTLSSAIVTGDSLRLTFSANLDTMSKPAAASFTVTVGMQTASISSVSISDKAVTLDLAAAIAGDETVTLAYQLPTANPLRSATGAVVAALSDQAVENRSPPLITSATVNGSTLTLQFDTALDTMVSPTTAEFTLTGAAASAVAVSASSVTITLSAAVAEAASVRLAYSPPADMTKGIRGTNGIRLGAIATRNVENTTDTTPVVSSATVNLMQARVVFDQALATAHVPAATAFAVTPASAAVSGVAVSGSTVTLMLAQAVAEGASATLAYTPPASGALRDGTGNQVAAFSVSLQNQTDTAPVLTASAVNGATLTLTFDQPLDEATKPPLTQFAVTGTTASAIAISSNTATITLNAPIADGAAITVQYTAPASGGFRDATGNAVASFTTQPSNSTDTAPTATAAAVAASGTELTITFSEALSEATADLPLTSEFALSGTAASVSAVAVSSTTVTLTLSSSVKEGETISVSYAAGGSKLLRDADQGQNAVAAFSISAENPVDYAASPSAASVNGSTLTITFDQAIKASVIPATTTFTVTVGGTSVSVNAVAISGSEVTLTLASGATAAQAVRVSYAKPSTGGLEDLSGLETVSFGPLAAANVTPPTLQSVTVDGNTMILTFDVMLDTTAVPDASAFAMVGATVSAVAVSGTMVTLTLAAAVHETISFTLTYTQPSTVSKRLKGANGAFVAAFRGVAVDNQTDTAPIVASAVVNRDRATITFDQDLDTSSTPAKARFALSGTTRTVTAVTVRNGTVSGLGEAQLTLSGNVREGAEITITYQPATGADGFLDPEGNAAAAFSKALENITDTAPLATSGSVDGAAITVSFDQPLDLMGVPAASTFSLSGTTATITTVRLRNDDAAKTGTLELTLSAPVAEGATVALTYTAPTALELSNMPGLKYLRDQQRNAASLSSFALSNLTDTAPVTNSAEVDGATLTVVFDQALDTDSVPRANAFSVNGGRTVNSASISGAELRLTLASAVADGDSLRLSYSPGVGNRLRDPTNNAAAAFSIDVDNVTDTAPTPQSAVTNTAGSSLTLTMNEAVKASSGTGALKDAFTLEGSSAQIDSTAINGAEVTLTFSTGQEVHELETVSLEYDPASGAVRLLDADQGAMPVSDFQLAVTNNTDTLPVVQSMSVDGEILTIVFDQPLAGTTGPPYLNEIGQRLNAFRINVEGAHRPFQRVEIDQKRALIHLSSSVASTDTVTLQYQDQGISPLVDQSAPANPVMSFDPQAVTNVTPAAPVSATIDGVTLLVTFDAALSTTTPAQTTFSVEVDDAAAALSSVSVSGSTLSLTLSTGVAEGASVTVAYTPPAAMSGVAGLTDARGRAVRAFSRSVTNVTDTTPVPLEATVDRATVSVRFDQPLSNAPTVAAFMVTETGATRAVTRVQIDDDELSLTLATSVEEGTAVRVAYTAPAAGRLSDATNNAVANFALNARNVTALGPRPVRAEARLTELVVTFDKALDASQLPPASAFSVSWAPDIVEVVRIRGSALTLRLAEPGAGPDSRMRLHYRGSNGALRGAAGLAVPNFTVRVADLGEPPKLTRVVGSHEAIILFFDGSLSSRHTPPLSWWNVFAGGERIPVSFVGVSSHAVVLVLKSSLPDTDALITAYYLPRETGSSSLRGAAGHRLRTLGASVENYTQHPPTVAEAVVDGAELTLRFSEAVLPKDTDAGWFSVEADGRPVDIVGADWRERSVVLRLSRAVTTREAIVLRYSPAEGTGMVDLTGLALARFEIDVDNQTPLAETLAGRRAAAELRARETPDQPFAAALRRELVRELGWRGGVTALLDARWWWRNRVAHSAGAPAFTTEWTMLPRGADRARIELRPVGNRALLRDVLGGPAGMVWERDADAPSVLSAWRVDLTDEAGVPLYGSAMLSVELPLPSSDAPLALIAFDLRRGSWERQEYELDDGVARLRVVAPTVVVFVALPLVDVVLTAAATPVVFEGAAQVTPQAFGALADDSVNGLGIQVARSSQWRYIAVDDPDERRRLRWGELVFLIRDFDAEPITVRLPMALDPR